MIRKGAIEIFMELRGLVSEEKFRSAVQYIIDQMLKRITLVSFI